jgi:hypothetical protein
LIEVERIGFFVPEDEAFQETVFLPIHFFSHSKLLG